MGKGSEKERVVKEKEKERALKERESRRLLMLIINFRLCKYPGKDFIFRFQPPDWRRGNSKFKMASHWRRGGGYYYTRLSFLMYLMQESR